MEQVMYLETRTRDLEVIHLSISEGPVEVFDVVRVFSGDGPARQFEAGQQRGGNYPCICGARAANHGNLAFCYHLKVLDFDDRNKIASSANSLSKLQRGNINPFQNLKKQEIIDELDSRHINFSISNKAELQEELTSLLHGIVRPPALMLSHPKKSSSELNIGQYEVLGCEPLHDITNLVQNVITELPNHIKDPVVQKQFQHFTATTIGNKNQLKGSDARMFAVKLTKFATTLYINQQLDINIMELINSLIDIVHICYSPFESRTPKSILRLHNQCFKFGIMSRIVFGIPTKMTTRKFFGSHFHSLTAHTSETYRIFNLKSVVTEQEERCFGDLRRVSESTTNRQAGHIVDNAIMRITTQQQLVYKQNSFAIQDSSISKQARLLPPRPRTMFSSELISNRSVLFTSHLKRIADFMICGKDVWWMMEDGNIVFFDGPDDPQFHREGPTLHHFRSSSLKKEQSFLLNTWQLILEMFEKGSLKLPLNKVKVVDDDGKSRFISFASNSNNNRAEQGKKGFNTSIQFS